MAQEKKVLQPVQKTMKLIHEVKERNSDGQKFDAFKVVKSDGRYMNATFTQECTYPEGITKIKESGMLTVTFFKGYGKGANIDTNREFDRMYIREVDAFVPFSEGADKAIEQGDIDEINDIFA